MNRAQFKLTALSMRGPKFFKETRIVRLENIEERAEDNEEKIKEGHF